MSDPTIPHETETPVTPEVIPGDFDIAVIGMAGRFPGAADLDTFWENLVNGVESVRDFTEEEVLAAGVDPRLAQDPHYVKRGGVLDGAELFDARFFGFYPREAEIMDPQQRVFLEVAWQALEHAGYDPGTYAGAIGLYAGCGMNSYLLLNLARNREIMETVQPYQLSIANDKDYLATRVSYKLNLRGPSVNVQTACSTSLVATHLACQALLNRECDMALAGGITIRLPQTGGYLYQEGGIVSPDGHCRPFDADAAGTVGGNGVGVVVLKRLADAIADGDTIHAIIKGTSINNDGANKVGYTAPSVDGQAQVISAAVNLAQVDPRTISYIETHGTGTAVGDPIEIAALTQVFAESTADRQFCAIGSVKANVGHLDAAAGVAGLIKTVLALEHKKIPPSINFTRPNPRIRFEETPFFVNVALRDWQTNGTPRRAGVSSFGIGGTNAHVVLEEAPNLGPSGPARPWHLFVLSAKSEPALQSATTNLRDFLARASDRGTITPAWLADVAYTLQVGRQAMPYRRAIVARDAEEAIAALSGQAPERTATGAGEPNARSVAFMFTGQGSQYVNMGRDLYRHEAVFRRWVDRCAELLRPHLGVDLRELLYPVPGAETDAEERIRQTTITQPALFTVEYALAQLWMSWGIAPEAMIGHSIGEYVAACLAGVMSLEDALAAVAARGKLMGLLPSGAMLSVALAEDQARDLLRGDPDLSIAAVNAPEMCVVSGPSGAIEALAHKLEAQGIGVRRLHTSHAFHSAMMDPILSSFTEVMYRARLHPPQIPYISNVTGTWITAEQATDPAYYAQHLRSTVRFADGVATLAAEPGRVLLEVGPGRALASLARAHPAVGRERSVITSMRHPQDPQDDQAFILSALGQLWLAGIRPNWAEFYAGQRRRRVPLPTYPFERRRYWIEPTPGYAQMAETMLRKESDIGRWFYLPSWRRAPLSPSIRADIRRLRHVLLLMPEPGSAAATHHLRQALREAIISRSGAATVAMPGDGFSPACDDGLLPAEDWTACTLRPDAREDYDALFADLVRRGSLPSAVLHLLTLDDTADFAPGQARGFDSLIALAQAWARHGQGAPLRIVIATTGLWDVTGEEAVRPAIATLIGAARVIAQEHPNISCRIVDVTGHPNSSVAEALVQEALADTAEWAVAYRGRYRWVQSFEPVQVSPEMGRNRLRERGVYLITGGLGRIGSVLAQHLATTCAARLVLVDRTPLPEPNEWDNWLGNHPPEDPTCRRIAQIRRLEGAGSQVLVLTADVADPQQMAAAVAQAEAHFGALHGVIHAAGTVGAAAVKTVAETDAAVREAQYRPKVNGTLALARALAGRELDFVMLMSSVSTVLGGLGFAAYAAANCFMDAFAAQQARHGDGHGQRWCSVAWDGWKFDEEEALSGRFSALDFAMTPKEGVEAFMRALALADAPQVIISTGDLNGRLAQSAHAEDTRPAEAAEGAPTTARHDSRPPLRTPYAPPTDDIERAIVADWEKTLGIEPIGIHDDFFELGGHSLLATQLVSRLRDRYRVELPLRNLFETPTVAGLAQLIRAGLSQAGTALAETARAPQVSIPRIPRPADGVARTADDLPLSFGQQRLWFLDQLDPGSPLYNNFAALRVTGDLDPLQLERSLNAVIARHEILRTTFTAQDGRPIQAILPSLNVTIPVADLRALPPPAQEVEIMRLAVEEAQTAFDLGRGPLLRCRLWRTGDRDYVLFFTMHHIVSDGWSVGVLIREMAALYQALSRPHAEVETVLPPLPIQYVDYAAWQRSWLSGENQEAELAFWRDQLTPAPPPLELPTDRPRPAMQTFRGGNVWFDWPLQLQQRLEALAQGEKATLFMALLAGLQALFHRYTNQEDFCIGTPVANRDRPETAGLIGFLLNTLVLRADLSGKPSFRTLLARTRETALKAYAHQELPFEMLVETLQPARDMSRSPFFQVMFDLQEAPLQALALPGISLQPLRVDGGTAKFDLALSMEYGPSGLSGYLNYNSDLFDADTARRMLEHLRTLLEAAVTDPDRPITALPMLTEKEQQLILERWSRTEIEAVETRPVAALFEEQVTLRPQQEALIMADGSGIRLTYSELDQRAGQLAGYLHEIGLGQEDIIALLLERSADTVVALLGALKAGVAFLPIDASYPVERVAFMLADAGARAVVTQTHVLQTYGHKLHDYALIRLDADLPEIARFPAFRMAQHDARSLRSLAYVIYTSGSTGLPKGVMVEQGELTAHLRVVADCFGLKSDDRVLQFSAYTFDQGLEQILATLITGGTLVMRGPEVWPPADFLRVLQDHNLTVINLPPAYWEQVLQTWAQADMQHMSSSLRLVISGGDVLTPQCLRLWQETPARQARLLNAYGPTEATITATTFDVPARWFSHETGPVPIGKPLPGRWAVIVDPNGNLVPAGVPGELLLGGIGLARGYLRRPDLTAERFVPDPYLPGSASPRPNVAESRLYRTGDLARWRTDGAIEFLGRVDRQVKVRGFRVELGEIEAALRRHPAIRQAAVVLHGPENERRIVAYIAMDPAAKPTPTELRDFLARQLPGYMVPAAFIALDALPVTTSGKIDRRNLPDPTSVEQLQVETPFVAPRTPVEADVAAIWSEVLKVPTVGVNDDFFDLGGHSLLATQILARLHQRYPVKLPLRRLFETPTVAGLAALIEEELLAQQNQEELEALLAELEGLSEDEARDLLARM